MPTLLMKAEVQGRTIDFEWDLESWLHDENEMKEAIAESELEGDANVIDSYEITGAGEGWHELESHVVDFSDDDLETLKHVYESIDTTEGWEAYCAWIDDAHGFVSDYNAFQDSYRGKVEDFNEFAMEEADSTFLLDVDDTSPLRTYFNYDAFADDLKYEYTVLDASDGDVFVFLNI